MAEAQARGVFEKRNPFFEIGDEGPLGVLVARTHGGTERDRQHEGGRYRQSELGYAREDRRLGANLHVEMHGARKRSRVPTGRAP